MKKNFVHLHVHSEYSLLDGLLRIDDLIKKAEQYEMPAVALTDHGNMYGVIDFYKSAVKAGIKPIIGCEVYQAPKSRFDKKSSRNNNEELYNHLTLLVKNKEGYRNLMKLVSYGFLEGFYYKPRIDSELLQKYSKGLIALSGCLSGKIPRAVEAGKIELANKYIQEYIEIFDKENFFIELTDFKIEKHKKINRVLFELAQKNNLKAVATNDVHYLNQIDYKYHFVLLCLQAGITVGEFRKYCPDIDLDEGLEITIKKIIDKLAEQELEKKEIDVEKSEKSGFFPRTREYYFKNYDQMAILFNDFPQVLENTLEVAQMCDLKLDFNLGLIPPFEVPDNLTCDEYLRKLCFDSIPSKYPALNSDIEKRLNNELEVIKKMGFAEYFLIVWDFVKFAKLNNIRVGPGRGSAAGSIVSYLLGITDIEPLKYNLLFERFLNEERKKMPDIDIDFSDEHRDKVIKYVTEKYGESKVAQLITFGTMAARQAIRDAGRVLEVPYSEVDRIAKLVPMELNMTIEVALDSVLELRELYEKDKRVREIIDAAKSLEGKARQHSIHAAGVVISADDLFNYTPIQRDEKSGDIKTQYKMEDVQEIGLLKMDFLGLKTLSLIDKTLFLIKKTKNVDLDINSINLDDKKTFDMITRGDCLGVFQLESSGMRELVINLKPEKFEDLIATLALFRPGPLQSGMVNDFVQAKNNNKKIKYLHPSLEPILKETYGIILYQEQIMMIASKIAGFTMSEADILRDAISKKKRDVITKQKNKFLTGSKNVGLVDEDTAKKLFELITHFAEYGFNKSHSTAYAMISYQTAFLKANYPVEFMAALLSIRMGSQEKVAQYINEARRMNIEVLPPDINESYADFTVVGNSIRFGLSAIKNVGLNVIEQIVEERKLNGKFKNFNDFCLRVPSGVLNKKTLESLIKAGVFDSLGYKRKYLMENFDFITENISKLKKSHQSGQFSLFEDSVKDIVDTDLSSLIEDNLSNLESDNEYSAKELLKFEKEMLGLYISGHPLDEYKDMLTGFKSIGELADENDKTTHTIAGAIIDKKEILTKSNAKMYFLNLEDLTDSIEVIVFPTVREKYDDLLKEGSVIAVKGRLDKKENREDNTKEKDEKREIQIKFIAIDIYKINRSNKQTVFKDALKEIKPNLQNKKLNSSYNKDVNYNYDNNYNNIGISDVENNFNDINNFNNNAESVINNNFGSFIDNKVDNVIDIRLNNDAKYADAKYNDAKYTYAEYDNTECADNQENPKKVFNAIERDIDKIDILNNKAVYSKSVEPCSSENIILKINKSILDKNNIDKLYKLFILHKGNVSVDIKIFNGDSKNPIKEYHIPDEFSINLSEEFYKSLKDFFNDKIEWEILPDIY